MAARVELTGIEATAAKLGRAQAALENPFELYSTIGQAMVESTKQRFDQGEDPAGNPWPASLRAQFDGGQTLVDTAALKKSITFIASADSVEVGTNIKYAATHQFGATITPKSADALRFNIPGIGFITSQSVTIPARPFIGLSDSDEIEIELIASDFLSAALGEGGRAG